MIGILTCKAMPGLADDDLKFIAALKKEKLDYRIWIWDETRPDEIDASLLIIRSTWDYHHNAEKFLLFLEACEKRGIQVLNSAAVVRWNFSKKYLLGLKEKNIPIVESYFFSNESELLKIKNQLPSFGWPELVMKPVVSASAHLTHRLPLDSPDFEKLGREILKGGEGIVQPFLNSITEDGEISLIYFNIEGPEYSHAVVKKPKSKDFRVQMEFGGSTTILQAPQELMPKLPTLGFTPVSIS
jgi:glutathione synthase/RimK-type ligase-like ATP-grasp enzyme